MNSPENLNIAKLSSLDFSRIKQPTVVALMKTHIKTGMDDFEAIKSTYKPGGAIDNYRLHFRKYVVRDSVNKVWESYITTNPSEAWNGKLLSFGALISKSSHSVLYPGGRYEGARAGQVLYLNLSLLMGRVQLAVAHEIIGVYPEKREMLISYVKGAESLGMQSIRFKALCPNQTEIEHATYYRSDSAFRDRFIYPFFHTLAVNDYHRNMRLAIKHQSRGKS